MTLEENTLVLIKAWEDGDGGCASPLCDILLELGYPDRVVKAHIFGFENCGKRMGACQPGEYCSFLGGVKRDLAAQPSQRTLFTG